jgi:hypothetical protein
MKLRSSVIGFTGILIVTAWTAPVPQATIEAKVMTTTSQKSSGEFSFIKVEQGKATATVSWGMATTRGIKGFLVQKTDDDPADPFTSWEELGAIPCDGKGSFKFTDKNIMHGGSNYRIIALKEKNNAALPVIATHAR